MTLYNQIYNDFGSASGDFVISWDTIPIHLTFFNGQTLVSGDFIESCEINFSALSRENETLGILKFWVNTILSMSLFIVLIVEIYRLNLKMLGIGSSYYNNQDEDEDELLESITETTTDSYEVSKKTGQIKDSNFIRHTTTHTKRRRL